LAGQIVNALVLRAEHLDFTGEDGRKVDIIRCAYVDGGEDTQPGRYGLLVAGKVKVEPSAFPAFQQPGGCAGVYELTVDFRPGSDGKFSAVVCSARRLAALDVGQLISQAVQRDTTSRRGPAAASGGA